VLSNYVLEIPGVPNDDYVLLHDTVTGKGAAVHSSVLHALKTGNEEALSRLADDERHFLADTFVVQDKDADRYRLERKLEEMRVKGNTLAVCVLLTTECNFACTYCHERGVFKSAKSVTTAEALRTADWIVTYANSLKVQRVLCYFYGGEPLMDIDLLVSFGKYLRKRAMEHEIQVQFDMSTNGSLLVSSVLDALQELGLKALQISIDGPKTYHDSRRPLKTGGSSYEVIMANLNTLSSEISCTIRINIDKQNIRDTWRVLPELARLNDAQRLTVYFDFVSDTHCAQSHCEQYVLRNTDELLGIVSLWRHQIELGFPLVGRKISEGACGHFSRYKITIDVDGYIYPCTGFAGIRDKAIGNVCDGFLVKKADELNSQKPWIGCLDCKYIALCFGGCRVQSFLQNGTLDSVVCRKEFLARANEEYLRLYYSDQNQRLLAMKRAGVGVQ
jgi:uncharacterized protein